MICILRRIQKSERECETRHVFEELMNRIVSKFGKSEISSLDCKTVEHLRVGSVVLRCVSAAQRRIAFEAIKSEEMCHNVNFIVHCFGRRGQCYWLTVRAGLLTATVRGNKETHRHPLGRLISTTNSERYSPPF